MTIQLVVGLGNPGPEYTKTRHNAGVWFVEELASRYNISLRPEKKYFGLYGKGLIGNEVVHLLVPTTFMNRSGQSVAPLANFFRIPVDNILVAHDELDMEPGVCKIKKGGGHGGHNGLRDIISCLANNKEFYRLRIGIGHPGHRDRVTGHVLGKAPAIDQDKIDQAIDEASRCIDIWQTDDLKKAQNRLHSFKPL
ncbi:MULTISPECIES: aminoacyl-tRNA hydrolase [unclassified Colwellia]|jgi:PTH1 family peptidyl-tRNA hydrolase|uniref:aminoacyl-tRNA hydrolase n=1 Tax=unclassified Colwellia TaxID=196834 RepID=UPI0015F655CA|nr:MULTISPECIES: aminoacyl-tRNA hydrolase [unclassified Colwellia]MBA6363757.1 aminoacyl-tRNA hydrolase [Colwellia sp. BRX8-8]MBA6337850.1 aminoacyl-tRNA hydrolase [Colwellia sp. BRX8-7]MBA6348931.1 aminoacyl-tRNA hydrolase [Colwellia sp. BRX8-9]MBA6352241.1 aminoacyl-tRNA hydrolase [Colwellia sp. BRX9-1]MBA6355922.1 aminoacyl-tRNA hydrolase [Colwellia sp. BRX8-3]